MNRYKITISYDGTAYAGWQIQPNGVAVQEKLESVIHELAREKTKVHGSGRTDHGVHARRQVAHFDLKQVFPAGSFQKSLNALLPPDIRILKVEKVEPCFHARRSAVSKEYRYFIWNADVMPPFLRQYRAHVTRKLNVTAMREAASSLIGQHDFAAFSANPNRKIDSNIRNLAELRIVKNGSEVVIIARANGFLYKMVRSLAGFLIRVGEGAIPASEARTILLSCRRTALVPTATPKGLFLWNVNY